MELQKQIEYLQQQLQQLQKQQNPQPQQNDTGEFIVKASMKSSVIALRIENLFLEGKKKIIMSGLGYAVPILIDAVMLIRKDMSKRGVNIRIEGIELFEETVESVNAYKKMNKKNN